MYMDEEETRYYLPLKEYVAYCESLRVVVRRQEALQRHVEKCEEVLSSKAEAKEALAKEVRKIGREIHSIEICTVTCTELRHVQY